MDKEKKPDNNNNAGDDSWSVYIIKASDNRLYTGITNNMAARWLKHSSNKGAKFFRGRKPVALCYNEPNHSKREYQIKQLSRTQKQQLISQHYGPFLLSASDHHNSSCNL